MQKFRQAGTNSENRIAEMKLQGMKYKKEVFLPKSEILRARGDHHTVKKSTKLNNLSTKVLEMRKIWEDTPVLKCQGGPRNSDIEQFCDKQMGGLNKPTVLGPANSVGRKRL